jgi:broad specificity phosphatase PhoE
MGPIAEQGKEVNGGGWIRILVFYLVVQWRFWWWRSEIRRRASRKSSGKESVFDSMKQTVLIVRHGQTAWNVEHRLPGHLSGVALNERGHQQAAQLAQSLADLPISSIISSPLERALDTASYIAKGRNLEIQQEPDLMDTDLGPWSGQVIEELSKNDASWKAFVKDPTHTVVEGVETLDKVEQRVAAAVERWLAKESTGSCPVFVAHADVIKMLLAHFASLDVGKATALPIDNASVSIVELEKDKPAHVVSIGWSPHPGWLKPPVPDDLKKVQSAPEESGNVDAPQIVEEQKK